MYGALALLVSPLSVGQGLWFLTDRKPALTLTDEGFIDRTGLLSPGFVRWDEVTLLRPTRFFLVGVKTADWPRLRNRLSIGRRLLSILSFQVLGSDFHVSSFGVAADRATLLRVLRVGHERRLRAAVVTSPPPPSPDSEYVEDRQRLRKILVVGVAILACLPWLFSHGFVRIARDPWTPVDWIPWGITPPVWLTISTGVVILGALAWDVAARRFGRPVTLRLTREGIAYRTLSIPWSAIRASYLVRPDAIGVELDPDWISGLEIPRLWRLRMAFDCLRGAPHVTLSVAGTDFTRTTLMRHVLAQTRPSPSLRAAEAGALALEAGP